MIRRPVGFTIIAGGSGDLTGNARGIVGTKGRNLGTGRFRIILRGNGRISEGLVDRGRIGRGRSGIITIKAGITTTARIISHKADDGTDKGRVCMSSATCATGYDKYSNGATANLSLHTGPNTGIVTISPDIVPLKAGICIRNCNCTITTSANNTVHKGGVSMFFSSGSRTCG